MARTVRTGESYFPSVERANEAVAYALDFNHERIRRWVAEGASRPLRVYAVPGGVTGPGEPFVEPQDLEAVRAVLVRSADSPSGYTVFTAYPRGREHHGAQTSTGSMTSSGPTSIRTGRTSRIRRMQRSRTTLLTPPPTNSVRSSKTSATWTRSSRTSRHSMDA